LQPDVAVGVVPGFPVEMAEGDVAEQAGRLDLAPGVWQLARPDGHRSRRQPLAYLVVDVLDLGKERVAAVRQHVRSLPEGQMAAGTQQFPGSLVPDRWVDPMPGRRGEDQVVGRRPVGWPPGLVRADDDRRVSEGGQIT